MYKQIIQLAVFFFFVQISAQKKITFKYQVQENTVYKTEMTTNIDGVIHMDADEATLEQMRKSGMELPIKMTQNANSTIINTTYASNSKGSIPTALYYEKMESETVMNGNPINQDNMFKGLTVYGKYAPDNSFKIDTITGDNLTDQIQKVLSTTIQQLQNQITFPKEAMAIGDYFKDEVPMSIPMATATPVDILLTSVYTLVAIKGELAFFDVDQTIDLNSSMKGMDLKASGQGKGSLEYDIKNNFPKRYSTDLHIKMNMTMPNDMNMDMDMVTKTSLSITTKRRE